MSILINFPTPIDLEWVFNKPWTKALICSPWLPSHGISLLEQAMIKTLSHSSNRTIKIWFRITPDDVVNGKWTDAILIQDFIKRMENNYKNINISLKTADQLHAKIYATDMRAYLSSANLSASGFGLENGNKNIEFGIRFESDRDLGNLWIFIEEAEKRLETLPKSALASIAEALNKPSIKKEIETLQNKTTNLNKKLKTNFPEMPHHDFPLR